MAFALGLFTAAVNIHFGSKAARAEQEAAKAHADAVRVTGGRQYRRDLMDLEQLVSSQAAAIADNNLLFEGSPLMIMHQTMEMGLEDANARRDAANREALYIQRSGRARARAVKNQSYASAIGAVAQGAATQQAINARLGDDFLGAGTGKVVGNSSGNYLGGLKTSGIA